MTPLYLGIGLVILGILLLWFLGDTDMHDERGCLFDHHDDEVNKNLMTFLQTPNGYPKEKLHCPECDSELELRQGIVRNPSEPRYPYRSTKSWVCPKHNWGWEKVDMS